MTTFSSCEFFLPWSSKNVVVSSNYYLNQIDEDCDYNDDDDGKEDNVDGGEDDDGDEDGLLYILSYTPPPHW